MTTEGLPVTDGPGVGLFQQIVEAAPSAMLVSDSEGLIRMANAEAVSMFGYARTQLLGSSIDALLPVRFQHAHPAHRASYFSEPSRRSMGAGRDLYARRQDGSEFPVEIGLNPIQTDQGLLVLSVVVDITERNKINARVKESLALQAAIVLSSDDAIISESLLGQVTSWNPGAERMFGYTEAEAVGRYIFDLTVPEESLENERTRLAKIRTDGVVQHFDTRRHRKDGRMIDVAVTVSPLHDERGELIGLTVIKRDVSVRKRQEERFQTVVESMPNGVLIVNHAGIIELANANAERIFGYSRQELIGQPVELLLPDALRAAHPGLRSNYFSAPSVRAMGAGRDLLCRRKDGSEFPVEIGLSPISNDHGTTVLAAITDVSERTRANQIITEHRDELARSNAELSTFAYVASHDLKSPLRGIDQLSKWIAEDLKDNNFETIPDHLTLLQSRIMRMENLLDDLLAYSRVGRVTGAICQIDVAKMAAEVFEMLAPSKPITLTLAPDLPVFTTLATPFEQILRNLFSNAIKHHDRATGHIVLSCRIASDRLYEFTVSDDGPGIPQQYQERIFLMFQTLRPRDEVEGSGMGLALVKKLAETNGGSVTIDSDGVRGSEFRFTWPRNTKKIQST